MDDISQSFYKMSKHRSGNMICVLVEIDGIPRKSLMHNRLSTIVSEYPVLQSIPREKKGWVNSTVSWEHKKINIGNHLVFHEKKRYDERNFRNQINKIIKKPFLSNSPEWMCYYISYTGSNKSYVIWKCHHHYGDGFQVTQFLKHFLDDNTISYPERKRKKESVWTHLYSFILIFLSLFKFIFFYKKENLPISKEGAENDDALFYHCKTWDLSEIKRLKNFYGVTVNDLIYTILIKSLQRYCDMNISLASISAFNLRNFGKDERMRERMGNNISFMILNNTIHNQSPQELLDINHTYLKHYKSSLLVHIIGYVLHGIHYISPPLVIWILKKMGSKTTFGMSNFQTFMKRKYIQGFRILNISNIVIPYIVGSFFSIVSYDDKITLNMCYRKRNFTSPTRFVECLERTYEEFLK